MSGTNRRGTAREYDVIDAFVAAGFRYAKAHRSGQAIAERRAAARISGDVFVYRTDGVAFQIEVGGAGKRVDAEIREIRERLLPGFTPLVVLYRDGAVKSADVCYYLSSRVRFESVEALLRHVAVPHVFMEGPA